MITFYMYAIIVQYLAFFLYFIKILKFEHLIKNLRKKVLSQMINLIYPNKAFNFNVKMIEIVRKIYFSLNTISFDMIYMFIIFIVCDILILVFNYSIFLLQNQRRFTDSSAQET